MRLKRVACHAKTIAHSHTHNTLKYTHTRTTHADSAKRKRGADETEDGGVPRKIKGSYGTHQPNCVCAVCVARRKKKENTEVCVVSMFVCV